MIAKTDGSIKRLDEHEYQVKSQSGNGVYQVLSTEFGWVCSCPDNQHRGLDCKHILGVQISLAIRKVVKEVRKIQPIEGKACIFCASEDLMKWGIRHNKSGDIQKFKCRGCGKFFTINLGFEGMKHSAKAITTAMQLYFSGESLRNAQRSLKLLGVKVTHKTVWSWIRKYVKLMEEYLDKITPTVGDVWRTDELYIKMKGNMKYLFAMMDDETRFRIAQQVADHKGTSDVRPMFRKSIEVAEKKPKVLISDGANNFHDAYRKEMWDTYGEKPSPTHIREIRMEGQVHNNKMERQNGSWRDREKVMRSLKTVDSPVIGGMQIFHNYIHPHMGLDGKTPAEAAGIKIEGENPWKTVIQNASKANRK